MPLYFYNTLKRKKELFAPGVNKRVNLFVCGPTVYDYSHIGHAKTYITFDAIVKYLKYKQFKVFYLQNITDIDDKIINRAKESGQNPLDFSKNFTNAYLKDMAKIKIGSVNKYAPASKFIPQIIKQIEVLITKCFAYESNGSVYFNVSKFKDYGKLSGQSASKLKRSARLERDPDKKQDLDFVLWKKAREGEHTWKSPWGNGRPGWHIEDTAISEHYFGSQYDIHGGANELKFPHHEAEIAQQESASGKKPFVKYWLHTGVLKITGEKMSKSLKNFITIRDFLNSRSAESLRLLVFQHHYRKPLDYSENSVRQTEKSIQKIHETFERLKIYVSKKQSAEKISPVSFSGVLRSREIKKFKLKEAEEKFKKAMDNDFDTTAAFADFFSFLKKINSLLDKKSLSMPEAKDFLYYIKIFDKIFGIIPPAIKTEIPPEVKKLAEKREVLRKQGKWKEADEAREEIQKMGWIIQDEKEGYALKQIKN